MTFEPLVRLLPVAVVDSTHRGGPATYLNSESGDSPEMHVQDRLDTSRAWWPKALGERDREDYAIVSRILNSKTGSILVIIAGLTHRGTQAAGDFTTNPELVAEFTKMPPRTGAAKTCKSCSTQTL